VALFAEMLLVEGIASLAVLILQMDVIASPDLF
jgi:hypothetical protein